jgi:hypothetical protein
MKEWMKQETTVNGWDFEYVENDYNDRFYQCRGEVMYDDEHDEMPEPGLWDAAIKLEDELTKAGVKCEANHSEKGWVEVTILNKK